MARTKYTSEILRERLGETLDALLDKSNPMDLDRAKAVAEVAQTMINVAKVEIDYARVTGGAGTGFIVDRSEAPLSLDDNSVDDTGFTADSNDETPSSPDGKSDGEESNDDSLDLESYGPRSYSTRDLRHPRDVTIHRGTKY